VLVFSAQKEPPGHSTGAASVVGQYFPSGQADGALAAARQYVPLGQGVMAALLAGQKLPAVHTSGTLLFSGQYVPPTHTVLLAPPRSSPTQLTPTGVQLTTLYPLDGQSDNCSRYTDGPQFTF
jgi:hypothetical protein